MKIEYFDLGLPNRDKTDDKVILLSNEFNKFLIQSCGRLLLNQRTQYW